MTRLVDLTRKIEVGMPVWPGDPLFDVQKVADHETDGCQVSRWTLGTHLGTHLDFPRHFFENGETGDSFPVDAFFRRTVVLDLTPILFSPPVGPPVIDVEILEPFALVFERFPAILLKTAWENRFGRPDFFFAFPSLTPETADWLADFPFELLGLETPSLSAFGNALFPMEKDDRSERNSSAAALGWGREGEPDEALLHSDAEAHRIFLGRTPPILLLEGLRGLEALPSLTAAEVSDKNVAETSLANKAFQLACFPLPVEGTDGSPVRAVAFLPDGVEAQPRRE